MKYSLGEIIGEKVPTYEQRMSDEHLVEKTPERLAAKWLRHELTSERLKAKWLGSLMGSRRVAST